MPTVQEIHTIWPIARVLASNYVSNGALYGKPINPLIPLQIELIGYAVDYQYEQEDIAGGSTPSASLTTTSYYLYQWLREFYFQALALSNSGGVIPNPSGLTIYGYPIQGIYTAATDGESVLELRTISGDLLPTGAVVVWAEKSILPLNPADWSWVAPNLNLLNGVALSQFETLSFLYVVPVT